MIELIISIIVIIISAINYFIIIPGLVLDKSDRTSLAEVYSLADERQYHKCSLQNILRNKS